MSLSASLRYWKARLMERGEAAPFLREGLGIEGRAKRLAAHWAGHQEATRAAQERWLEGGARLAVLGAGRLYDFSRKAGERYGRVRLVDADPLCRQGWAEEFGERHEAAIEDVTGCLAAWAERLRGMEKVEWAEMLAVVRELRAEAPAAEWLAGCDGVVSLNLLSQIAVGWEDRVQAELERRYGKERVRSREEEWLAAAEESGRRLVEGHLRMLNGCGAKRVLVVTDLEFVEYRGSMYEAGRWAEAPLAWEGEWKGEAGLECAGSGALCGVEAPGEWMSEYEEAWAERWVWHIRPQGTEGERGCGELHLVGAFGYERRPSAVR